MGSTAATPAGRRRSAARASTTARRANAGGAHRSRANGSGGQRRPTRARSGGASSRKRTRRPTRRERSPWIRRVVAGVVLLVALAAGYFLWLRDSSLVAVTDVSVVGVETGERQRITAAFTRAGEEMTTLNVDAERLEAVAARFPTVESVRAAASFPRGLEIAVVERPPVLAARAGGTEVAVAADGTLLPGLEADEALPRLDVDRLPPSGRLRGEALAQALVVGAAPEPLRPLVRRIRESRQLGVEARMRGGIELRFGSGANAEAKWAAVAAVLADPALDSVSYVDVRVPERPAVGGAEGS